MIWKEGRLNIIHIRFWQFQDMTIFVQFYWISMNIFHSTFLSLIRLYLLFFSIWWFFVFTLLFRTVFFCHSSPLKIRISYYIIYTIFNEKFHFYQCTNIDIWTIRDILCNQIYIKIHSNSWLDIYIHADTHTSLIWKKKWQVSGQIVFSEMWYMSAVLVTSEGLLPLECFLGGLGSEIRKHHIILPRQRFFFRFCLEFLVPWPRTGSIGIEFYLNYRNRIIPSSLVHSVYTLWNHHYFTFFRTLKSFMTYGSIPHLNRDDGNWRNNK